jgi:hypothetical protein
MCGMIWMCVSFPGQFLLQKFMMEQRFCWEFGFECLKKETFHISFMYCYLLYLRRWMLWLRGHMMWPRAVWYMVTCVSVTSLFASRLTSSLKIKATSFSETSINIWQTTRHHIPEDRCLILRIDWSLCVLYVFVVFKYDVTLHGN